jgi:FkbM family methyltransferase
MKVGFVMPIGPGHEMLAEDAQDSIAEAYARHPGPFSAYELIVMDDTQGRVGRSASRNLGVTRAVAQGCDWVFFLDADDLLHPDAFRTAQAAIEQGYDAVWGAICELAADESGWSLRAGQLETIAGVADILSNEPQRTLQIGHFVRAALAARLPFAEDLDCGEDFDYYYRVWSSARCTKLRAPLFINRVGMHSTGPRSATGRQWREAVEAMIAARCREVGLHRDFTHDGENFRFYIHDPFDLIQRCHLQGLFFEAAELAHLRARLPAGLHVLEVGANVGNHAVYFGRFLRPRRLTLLEPNPAAAALLRQNLDANHVVADLTHLALGAGRAAGRYGLQSPQPHNLGATRLAPADAGAVEVRPLDALGLDAVDFVKIDVEGMEFDVLEGARQLITRDRPVLLIEIGRANLPGFAAWCDTQRYAVEREFAGVHAVNFVVAPRP